MSMKDALFAAGYGYLRGNIRDIAQPLIGVLSPAGAYADNLALGGGAYLLARYIQNPVVKQAARVIVINEAFLAGAKAGAGVSMATTGGSSSVAIIG